MSLRYIRAKTVGFCSNAPARPGRVAAVIIDKHDQKVTHILLIRLSQMPEYRLVPISIIEQVHEEKVLLRIFNPVVNSLPTWHES